MKTIPTAVQKQAALISARQIGFDQQVEVNKAILDAYVEGFDDAYRIRTAELDGAGWDEWAHELLRVMPYWLGEDESAREVIEDWALKGARTDTYPRGDAAWRELCVQRNDLWDEVVRRRRADTDPQPFPLIRPGDLTCFKCGQVDDAVIDRGEGRALGERFMHVFGRCPAKPEVPEVASPLDRQVGGDHYQGSAIQPISVIQAWSLRYEAGAVLKYIYRAGRKGPVVEDLDKAIHYLELWRADVIKNEEANA